MSYDDNKCRCKNSDGGGGLFLDAERAELSLIRLFTAHKIFEGKGKNKV